MVSICHLKVNMGGEYQCSNEDDNNDEGGEGDRNDNNKVTKEGGEKGQKEFGGG